MAGFKTNNTGGNAPDKTQIKNNLQFTGFCCEKPRRSRFCPDCGKDMRNQTTLEEILAHFYRTISNFEKEKKNIQTSHDDVSDEEFARKIEIVDRAINKWKTWATEIKTRIESDKANKIKKS